MGFTLKKIMLSLIFVSVCSVSAAEGTTKIMPLGDSITWDDYHGDKRSDSERSAYRNYLWYKLKEIGYDANFVGSQSGGQDIKPYFDHDHEGHSGYTSHQIAENVYDYLRMNTPDVILLHIGTNDWDTSPSGVEDILSEIDQFENNNNVHIKVILARIINRNPKTSLISNFNSNLESMARNRINSGDDIEIVDMEHDAGINYGSDLRDGTHPDNCGYEKMANVWFSALTGKGSPGLKYANCNGDGDGESLDALYAYPETLVDEKYILSSDVDVKTDTITFTLSIPESGITF
ncbi:MAG TPA: hypothetical protein ENK77_03385 [Epsilonproteobacteria bacterium]|nr:hypothetical protein [Campylobacterota bacterium]